MALILPMKFRLVRGTEVGNSLIMGLINDESIHKYIIKTFI